jgi:hypothetical protein
MITFYNTAVPTIFYESETWVLRRRDESRIKSCEMTFLRSVNGCTHSNRIKNDYTKELNIFATSQTEVDRPST